MCPDTLRLVLSGAFVILALQNCSMDANGARAKSARISGEVRDKAGRPLAGLALMEKGQIHNNVWHAGARISEEGRFEISLAEGGEYGLHVYSSGYIYSPQTVMLESGKTKDLKVVMVPEPTRGNDPAIGKVEFSPSPESPRQIILHVTDPNGDLGPQVLAFNAATGRPFAMVPPAPVADLKANFPNGAYRLEVPAQQPGARNWFFVVADHRCNTTDVLGPPHQPGKPAVVR
jgi:hypothetical protein